MVTSGELLVGLRTSTSYAERVTASFIATLVFLREQGGENQEFADAVGPELLEEYDTHRKQYDNLEDKISAEGTSRESQEGQCETLDVNRDKFNALTQFFNRCSAFIKNKPEYDELVRELLPEVLQILKTHLK